MNSKHLPLLAALVAVVLWAAAFVGIRAAGRSFSPGPLALGRLALGSVLLGALVLSRPTIRPTRRELALLVLAGLLWFGVYQVLLNEAERRVDAGTASMLVLIAPIFIVALAAVFLKERTTPNLLLGGALAFAGVVVIGLATSSRSASLLGVILCLAAALASAIGMVAEKPVLNRIAAFRPPGRAALSARSSAFRTRPSWSGNGAWRLPAASRGCSSSASFPRPSPSRRGPTHWRADPRGGSRRPPTSCRRSRSC